MMKLLSVLGVLLALHIASSTKLVCHVTNWSQYRPSNGKFTVDNIDPFLCTHIIYALSTINSFNQISPTEWNDEQHFITLQRFKMINPALKTLLSVGSALGQVSPFIAMVSRAESRAAFINSTISYLHTHNFDGLNLAWEFPAHNGSPEEDRERFTLLIAELVKAFEDDARDNKRTQLLLSASVSALRQTIDKAYEVEKIAAHLDFINIMTFDFHGPYDGRARHHSPLYRSSLDIGSRFHNNINSSVQYWLELGAPAGKLLLGFPTYGRTYRLDSNANGPGAPTSGPGDAGPYTQTAGFWSFYEICNFLVSATADWIPEQQVPFATSGRAWVGYDDRRSFSAKVQHLTANGLGGAHVWTLGMDDFRGDFCSDGPYPLTNQLRTAMGFPPKPTTTAAPRTTRDPLSDFCRTRPNGLYVNPADRNTFFQCFQGNTFLQRCQPGLVYIDSCKCCNYP